MFYSLTVLYKYIYRIYGRYRVKNTFINLIFIRLSAS